MKEEDNPQQLLAVKLEKAYALWWLSCYILHDGEQSHCWVPQPGKEAVQKQFYRPNFLSECGKAGVFGLAILDAY